MAATFAAVLTTGLSIVNVTRPVPKYFRMETSNGIRPDNEVPRPEEVLTLRLLAETQNVASVDVRFPLLTCGEVSKVVK